MKSSLRVLPPCRASGGILVLVASFNLYAAGIDDVLPLPQWPQDRSQNSPRLGGDLFPEGFEDGVPTVSALPAERESPPGLDPGSPQPRADLSLFLPDALLGRAVRPDQPGGASRDMPRRCVDGDFLAACLETSGSDHLIDPDSHLPETQREDLLRFLAFHARDARIAAYVVVMDGDQCVPSGVDLSGVASGALKDRDSCLVAFPLGDPWRARLFVSNSLQRIASSDRLAEMVKDCAKDASQVSDALEQLHRFTVRLSIRLFWLERMIGEPPPVLDRSSVAEVPGEVVAKREAALASALLDADVNGRRSPLAWDSVVLGVLLSLAGSGLAYAALCHRRKRLLRYVWVLPEIEMPPRLGGVFSGGGGCSIRYR